MNEQAFTPAVGDKVTFNGTAYVVGRIDGTTARLRAARHVGYGSRFATANVTDLRPYAPTPKVSRNARTCQICGRPIHAASGRIAHHGYQRPGHGWQTPSCEGALELPFESSREALGRHIEGQRGRLAMLQASAAGLEAGNPDVCVVQIKRDAAGRKIWDDVAARHETELVTLTADHPKYPEAKAARVAEVAADIRMTAEYIAFQVGRFENWQPAA